MNPNPEKPSLLDLPLKRWFPANLETLLVAVLILAAVVSRFYDLGARTMSHDEINHVVPSFSLYSGSGYSYDPMSHGPLQFHMISVSYALFGDNDFTSRIPAAVCSVATIILAIFLFRRYLGRTGAIIAGLLFLISPIMLFYGRYARDESYIMIWSLLTLYSILRYLERGEVWVLILFTAANALHFTDKVTSYMLAGEQLVFLAGYLVYRLARREWPDSNRRPLFLLGLAAGLALGIAGMGLYISQRPVDTLVVKIGLAVLGLAALGVLAWAIVMLVKGLGWAGLRQERSLDLLMMLSSLVLPLTGAVPLSLVNSLLTLLKKPTFLILDYTTDGMLRVGGTVAVLMAISAAIGIWWFGRRWLLHAALFFVPIGLLYTTFLTNPQGIIGGFVGALSYWSVQQGVARGGQPWYYYIFLLIPVYEFLPALGTIAAAVIASVRRLWQIQAGRPFESVPAEGEEARPVPVAVLFVFWSVCSIALFTYAGEKMPWLTIHLSLPMILASAWGLGWMIETIPWGKLAGWGARNYVRAVTLAFFTLLAVLTGRAAFRAAYINYNNAFEYLVYAHAAADPKILFDQIQELSLRTTGDATDIVAAYDNDVRYPYWWYMRRFPNRRDFDVNPTRDLRTALVIAAGDGTVGKLTPVVQENYNEFNGMRLWWPSMDYWSLKWDAIQSERNAALAQKNPTSTTPLQPMTVFEYLKYSWLHIRPFFTDPKVFNAVWQIWFNRDYTAWGALRNSDAYTLTKWGVSNGMHYFIRKDLTAQLWPYGATAEQLSVPTDPYAAITIPLAADRGMGTQGSGAGQFNAPHGIALAPDGSLYVADSLNQRIQHLGPDGQVLQSWGTFADVSQGNAPGGTFNEPWGVAVGPDGSVYVADTWNHRIQKFTADGRFVTMWGTGPGGGQDQFYGPRGIAVNNQGLVFVADTGNKRVVIYDADGKYVSQFGEWGAGPGQLDEPVDVALDGQGNVYVTDTWNQRIQKFTPQGGQLVYAAVGDWPVEGWNGQSLENKPFITVDADGIVYITDPELARVIAFSPQGKPLHVWDGYASGTLALASGIVSDGQGGLWVMDARNGTLVHFKP